MNVENIPPWLAIILVVTLVPVAVYLSWILPGYEKDKEEK